MRGEEEIKKAIKIIELETNLRREGESEEMLDLRISHSGSFITALRWALGEGPSLSEMEYIKQPTNEVKS